MEIQAAMKSPGAVFGDPEVLESVARGHTEQKRAILSMAEPAGAIAVGR